MQNQGTKGDKISAAGAAGTNPMATGKKQINDPIHARFPRKGKVSGTDDGPDRHKIPPDFLSR